MIECNGGRGLLSQGDVLVAAVLARIVDAAKNAGGGRIDILLNVAGGLVARKTVAEMDGQFWDEVIALNLKSVFLVTKAVLPHMPDGGTIVNFSSQAARDGGGAGARAYGAPQAGVTNFTPALAQGLAPRRDRADAIAP